MSKDFINKNEWALILGGSSGLGLASAKKLALHGMNIIIVHRNRKSEMKQIDTDFNEIREIGIEFLSFNIDLLKEDKQKEVITNIKNTIGNGLIKTIIHSVAKGNLKPMVDATHVLKNDDFRLTIDAMAISLYDWVSAVFKAQLFTKDTRVISFTSEGNTKAWTNYAAVSAAKVALEAISRSIALEFAPYGVKANCLQPGAVDTQSLRMIPGYEQLIANSLQRNPFNRITTPEDVANAVYLLCKDEAAWINGCIIPVNGGEHLN
ncbi:SDR family oxidoreductase [Aquimarina aquimarini]|uniref:SDR family oxidoreductase n=1 Tax=Aquimarina aquimarini TaxID=1191734 RepID=UPI000D55564E|nr:SDR family oxidoreductase [Aquimarina aquimarini]